MDWGPIVTASGAFLAALTAAVGTIYVARSKTKSDIATSITSGFEALTNQLQEERKDLIAIIDRHVETIDKHRDTIEKQHVEIEDLRREKRKLNRRIDRLERSLTVAGIIIPQVEENPYE